MEIKGQGIIKVFSIHPLGTMNDFIANNMKYVTHVKNYDLVHPEYCLKQLPLV